MTTPAIHAIKESIPGSQITLMTSPAGADPASFVPDVDQVISYKAPWMKSSPQRSSSQYDMEMIQRLQREGFDGAVIFTVYSQNPLPAALTCYLANIPLRLAHCRENPYHLLTHRVKETEPEEHIRHEVQRQLDLVGSIGCQASDVKLRFQNTPQACLFVHEKLYNAGVNLLRPWIVLHPGVTAPSRQYDPKGYAQIARQLSLEDGLQVVFTGTERECALVEQVQEWMKAPSYNLVGQLSIDELGALLQLAPLLLSNNTGPVHLAAAMGTPVVDLYALTNPQHTPWEVPNKVLFHDVPCKYCYKSICPEGHHNCLRLVSPQEVVQAVRDLMIETAAPHTHQANGFS